MKPDRDLITDKNCQADKVNPKQTPNCTVPRCEIRPDSQSQLPLDKTRRKTWLPVCCCSSSVTSAWEYISGIPQKYAYGFHYHYHRTYVQTIRIISTLPDKQGYSLCAYKYIWIPQRATKKPSTQRHFPCRSKGAVC